MNAACFPRPESRGTGAPGRFNRWRNWFLSRHLPRVALVLLACVLGRPIHAADLAIPGSGNPERVMTLLATAFNARQTRFQVLIPPTTGTAGAIRDVEAGTSQLGRVGRPLSEAERAKGLVYIPIGRDPVTFVAGAAVTVTGLTTQQVIDVFTGQITNWADLGGNPGPIRAIGREVNDASREAISRAIPAFRAITPGPSVKIVHLDPQLIELLDRFSTSFGFLNRSALGAARTALKHLSLDGVPATPEMVTAGQYPIWIEVGLIHRIGGPSLSSRAFISFIQSPEGAAILKAEGLLVPAEPPSTR